MGSNAYEPVADKGLISIGALADATGLSPATLRVWERRYGKPVPVRLASGHRRYLEKDIPWLRGVAEALARGHRPSELLNLSVPALEALLQASPSRPDDRTQTLLVAVSAYDRNGLESALLSAWERQEPLTFLQETLGPFLEQLGRSWAAGVLEVRHEHFASEVVSGFLHARRAELPDPGGKGGKILLTTLSGERHGLGLQVLALVCALEGVPYAMLGVETPSAQIVAAARELEVDRVVVSISLHTGGPETDKRLRELRDLLPPEVELAAGGAGARRARRGIAGVRYIPSLCSFSGSYLHLP